MEFKIKTGPQGHLYIPKKLRNVLGRNVKVLPNAAAVVLFPENVAYKDVLRSLEIISADLKHRINMQKKEDARDDS